MGDSWAICQWGWGWGADRDPEVKKKILLGCLVQKQSTRCLASTAGHVVIERGGINCFIDHLIIDVFS